VLLGLSGALNSAIVATHRCGCAGADNVRGVMLPSEYTSKPRWIDAESVRQGLAAAYWTYVLLRRARGDQPTTLAPLFDGTEPTLTRGKHPVAPCAGCC